MTFLSVLPRQPRDFRRRCTTPSTPYSSNTSPTPSAMLPPQPPPTQVGDYLRATFPPFRGQVVSARTVITALRRLRCWLEHGMVHHVF
jgi:hypothetical protein